MPVAIRHDTFRAMTQRHVSLPAPLDVLLRRHRARLPCLSGVAVEAWEEALRAIGVDVPARPEPGMAAAATEAARVGRAERATNGATEK